MASSQVFLKDTDERACAYIAGPAPNRWGFTFEGKNLLESVINVSAFGKFLVSKILKLSQIYVHIPYWHTMSFFLSVI